jgi:hypothetical protein
MTVCGSVSPKIADIDEHEISIKGRQSRQPLSQQWVANSWTDEETQRKVLLKHDDWKQSSFDLKSNETIKRKRIRKKLPSESSE